MEHKKSVENGQPPTYCKGCSFKCQATECDCICHDKMRAFYANKNLKKFLDKEQIQPLCDIIGDWYFDWKDKMTDNHTPHRLGFAREDLKRRLEGVVKK